MGACKWSPRYAAAHLKYKYLRLSMSRRKGKKISAKFLWKVSKQIGMTTETLSDEELTRSIVQAHKAYQEVKNMHKTTRQTFI